MPCIVCLLALLLLSPRLVFAYFSNLVILAYLQEWSLLASSLHKGWDNGNQQKNQKLCSNGLQAWQVRTKLYMNLHAVSGQ
ncbi:hypothetical protein J3R30DRAFT_3524323 [Lentinula aciculospora]|uniref:Secreted protein n=1 Tax=Lentinula aciculospora TaxID=153920 RepID=A0A9W9A1F7_9AGAR|nr:hypothetical protein J3R30DRAFT_3524323 [Lentinula aciculospora]